MHSCFMPYISNFKREVSTLRQTCFLERFQNRLRRAPKRGIFALSIQHQQHELQHELQHEEHHEHPVAPHRCWTSLRVRNFGEVPPSQGHSATMRTSTCMSQHTLHLCARVLANQHHQSVCPTTPDTLTPARHPAKLVVLKATANAYTSATIAILMVSSTAPLRSLSPAWFLPLLGLMFCGAAKRHALPSES